MAQVIVMERLRQAVWHGLEDKLGDKANLQYNVSSALPGGRMFATPTAYLRPNISSHGRGEIRIYSHSQSLTVAVYFQSSCLCLRTRNLNRLAEFSIQHTHCTR